MAKKSFLEKIGLVENTAEAVVDNSKKEEKNVTSSTPTSSSTYVPTSSSNFATNATAPVVADEKFSEYLNKVFTDRNFPGPDYQEFRLGLKNLANVPLDQKTKFITAYSILQAQGVDKMKLINTANEYIRIAEEQRSDFKATIQNALNTDVAKKEQTVVQLTQENEKLEEQMRQLIEKKNKNLEVINSTAKEISDTRNNLQLKEVGFNSACDIFIKTINDDIRDIEQYIQ